MIKRAVLWGLAIALPVAALAQGIGVPAVNGVVGRVSGAAGDVLRTTATLGQTVASLATLRLDRLDTFVQAHRATVERDDTGAPARAHEVLLLDPDPAALRIAADSGFVQIDQGDLDGLGLGYARLRTPPGKGLSGALRTLRSALPGRTITADQIHFASGSAAPASGPASARPADARPAAGNTSLGIIDGGVRPSARIIDQAGFATGAPHPDAHAQAIVSLLAGAGTAHIHVADVYGTDPAGGDALAIARALGWMQNHGVRVVSISLVGPANPLLARAIALVQARGLVVVAAVGNDGAAAPAAYPASYPGVVAVTGVDARNRVLFEAGHALHLDYAGPGADLTAIGLDGRAARLRGTSFAAPLVASRLAALAGESGDTRIMLERANREAIGPGPRTGRGILCDTCRKGL
ncbi:S8 family serine peptidase [Novosphingobium sp.]|uniref:S8 family serine peptidase n=1 Tax=Novosphingobium sp. TaxID=1874826 RepID=UPI003D09CEBA